jgi:hypothetical protein
MLNTFIELKEPLEFVYRFITNTEFKNIYLNSVDWFTIQQLRNLFNIFVKPLVKLQAEVYTTLPKSLLYIYKIYIDLEKFIQLSQNRIDADPTLVSYFFI